MSCWQNSLFQFLLLPVIIITALSIDIKNNASTIPNDGRIVAYELKLINETVNTTYHDTLYRKGKCPDNDKKICMIPYFEKKIRSIPHEVMKRVPVYKCLAGYELRNDNCFPICKNDCTNGFCTAPELCECFTDFTVDANDPYKCNPVCDECEHGVCISPKVCECNDGYQWNTTQNKCIPICATNCPNGKCIAPNNCSCNYGYRPTNESDCAPVCEPNCENGFCVEPNHCECNIGYRFKEESSSVCEPICEPSCNNASNCIAPNRCECHIRNGSSNDCQPICELFCKNGECSAANECKCSDGYRTTGLYSDCEPVCEPECVNARCVEPNRCECKDGYEQFSNEICCPICETGEYCANDGSESVDICNRPEEFRLSTTDNYVELTEAVIIEAATNILPKDKSTSNWWTLAILAIFILSITAVGYWQYKNRKVNYYIRSDAEASIHYSKPSTAENEFDEVF